jgi:membrane fusion protein (multidrug efflux system)
MKIDGTEMLKPGMFARFSIIYDVHDDVVLVPYSALVDEDYENVVFVVEDGIAHRKVVTTGITSDGKIEITDGLDGHERVVVVGQNGLKEGTSVAEQAG